MENQEENKAKRYKHIVMKKDVYSRIEQIRKRKHLPYDTHVLLMLLEEYERKHKNDKNDDWMYQNSW